MQRLLDKAKQIEENYQGKRFIYLLIAIFVVFLILGAAVGFGLDRFNKVAAPNKGSGTISLNKDIVTYEGVVTYVDPEFYPLDDISFILTERSGKEIILLKATDQKLLVAEGHYVVATGKLMKTEGKHGDMLLVDKVVIKNGTN